MRDRGVSEVIAFILVFSIVITSVGLLYTAGFGSIVDIQESETDRSAERAFGASAIALEDIQRGRASSRAFDLELSGRTLTVDDAPTLTATVDGTDVDASGTLVYGPGSGTEIGYQSGAIVRDDGDDAELVSREPLFRCVAGEHAVATLVSVDGPPSSVSTDGTLRVVASGPAPEVSTIEASGTSGGHDLEVDFGGARYETAWERYFDDHDEWTRSGTTATCPGVDRAYVRHVQITLEYQGV